ncbi:Inactive dipeptidyl peptidase 10, partial [Cichlidogyrus casuarinus]
MFGKYLVCGKWFFDTETRAEGLIDMNNLGKRFRHGFVGKRYAAQIRGNLSQGPRNLVAIGSKRGSQEQPLLLNAVADPTGQRIAFVDLQYQLYYEEEFFNRSDTILTHVTKGLPSDNFQYAYPDWLYGEEVFETDTAMWWSPDGMKLAFAAFNETNTNSINITLFEANESFNVKYPKAGELNQKNVPIISVYVHGVETKETRLIPKPSYIAEDAILSFAKWITDDVLLLSYLDRPQLTHQNKQAANEPIAIPKENKFLIILPQEDEIGFRAIASLDL